MASKEVKKARTAIYAAVYGPADTAKRSSDYEVEHQLRARPVYTIEQFGLAAEAVVELFAIAKLDPRREWAIIRYLNKHRPKGADLIEYAVANEDDPAFASYADVNGAFDPPAQYKVRDTTRNVLASWSAPSC